MPAQAHCPNCCFPVALTESGRFVLHNDPGDTRCPRSGRPAVAPFHNSRYEYTTREWPTIHGETRDDADAFHPDFEAVLERDGWQRVWTDITLEGSFGVYRRARRERPHGHV